MRNKVLQVALIALIALALSACSITFIEGSGNIVTEQRAVSGFDRIEMNSIGELVVTQTGSESLSIETDDNLLQYIITTVENGTLTIELDRDAYEVDFGDATTIKPTDGIRFTVEVDELNEVEFNGAGSATIEGLETTDFVASISGAGKLEVSDLAAESLDISLSGAGELKASGSVVDQSVRITGAGAYNGADLYTVSTTANISGAGSATVWATTTLDVTISGAGGVSYYGGPTVTKNISGPGVLTDKGAK